MWFDCWPLWVALGGFGYYLRAFAFALVVVCVVLFVFVLGWGVVLGCCVTVLLVVLVGCFVLFCFVLC